MKRSSFTEDYKFEVVKEYEGYSVSLPHQCDSWEIIGAEVDDDDQTIPHNGGYAACPLSKEIAVNQMELFVKRATEALEKLKALD